MPTVPITTCFLSWRSGYKQFFCMCRHLSYSPNRSFIYIYVTICLIWNRLLFFSDKSSLFILVFCNPPFLQDILLKFHFYCFDSYTFHMWFNLFLCTIVTADMFVLMSVIRFFCCCCLSSQFTCAQFSFNNNFCWTQTDRQKVKRVSPLTVTARHETWYFSWNHSNKVWDTLFEILCLRVLFACVVQILLGLVFILVHLDWKPSVDLPTSNFE